MRREQLDQLWGAAQGPGASALPDQIGPPSTDTRTLTGGSLFVPLVGEHHDGHSQQGAHRHPPGHEGVGAHQQRAGQG